MKIIGGVCQECGAQVAMPGTHIQWHANLMRVLNGLYQLDSIHHPQSP